MNDHAVGYSVGTVLFGWMMAYPALLLGHLVRNKLRPRLNPWIFPLAWLLFVDLLGFLSLSGAFDDQPHRLDLAAERAQDLLILCGLLPALVWTVGGWLRFRRMPPEE